MSVIKMDTLQMMSYNGFKKNVVIEDGEMMFMCSDIAKCIGDKEHTLQNRVRLLPTHLKKQILVKGRTQGRNKWFVTEPGLYRVILRSRNAGVEGSQANKFLRWVTELVLPEIRKKGQYKLEQEITALTEKNTDMQKDLIRSNKELKTVLNELRDTNDDLLATNYQLEEANNQLVESNRMLQMGISNIVIDELGLRRHRGTVVNDDKDTLFRVLRGLRARGTTVKQNFSNNIPTAYLSEVDLRAIIRDVDQTFDG